MSTNWEQNEEGKEKIMNTNKQPKFMDVHIIQTIPPACVNRDQLGLPKTAIFGGVQRARVSSQAWKKAIRDNLRDMFGDEKVAKRTRYIAQLVAKYLEDDDITEEEAIELAKIAISTAIPDYGFDDEKNLGKVLVFVSEMQAKALADVVKKVIDKEKTTDLDIIKKKLSVANTKKELKSAISDSSSIDQALFGRMVAQDPTLSLDGCCSVSHAISTHPVETEIDFFTVVDDNQPFGETGSAHMGERGFSSPVLYRYATVDLEELKTLIGEDASECASAFVKTFSLAMPTGATHGFANFTIPSLIYVSFRDDIPINLSDSFEAPIYPNYESNEVVKGISENSIDALAKRVRFINENFNPSLKSFYVGEENELFGKKKTLDGLMEEIKQVIS